MADPNLPPISLAFVLDGQVVDVLHTDDRLAAIFLSQPLIVDVSTLFDAGHPVKPGAVFNAATGDFTNPGA